MARLGQRGAEVAVDVSGRLTLDDRILAVREY
jgi:hypothetical protein